MTRSANVDVSCRMVGDFVDEADLPTGPCATGESVRPQRLNAYLDEESLSVAVRDFTVLLVDGRSLAVRGHGLTLIANPAAGEPSLLAIIDRAKGQEEYVALFRSTEIVGIFRGELRSPSQPVAPIAG